MMSLPKNTQSDRKNQNQKQNSEELSSFDKAQKNYQRNKSLLNRASSSQLSIKTTIFFDPASSTDQNSVFLKDTLPLQKQNSKNAFLTVQPKQIQESVSRQQEEENYDDDNVEWKEVFLNKNTIIDKAIKPSSGKSFNNPTSDSFKATRTSPKHSTAPQNSYLHVLSKASDAHISSHKLKQSQQLQIEQIQIRKSKKKSLPQISGAQKHLLKNNFQAEQTEKANTLTLKQRQKSKKTSIVDMLLVKDIKMDMAKETRRDNAVMGTDGIKQSEAKGKQWGQRGGDSIMTTSTNSPNLNRKRQIAILTAQQINASGHSFLQPRNEYQSEQQSFSKLQLRSLKIKKSNSDAHRPTRDQSPSKHKELTATMVSVQSVLHQQFQSADTTRQSQLLNNRSNIYLSYDFFNGKLSVVWLFIISSNIDLNLLNKIKRIYKPLTDRDFQIPLCTSFEQALPYLKTESSVFKIILDLKNGQDIVQNNKHIQYQDKILSIYIYNNNGLKGMSQSSDIKAKLERSLSKKVSSIYTDLTPLLRRAQLEIENGNRFIKVQNFTGEQQQKEENIQQIKFKSKLPVFLKLTGEDKTEITKYRANLYGAIKLTDPTQRTEKLNEFVELVKQFYQNNDEEMKNLQKYLQIDHVKSVSFSELFSASSVKHFDVLRFYVLQTFYYKMTNNLLRISITPQQFRPCTIPFNQNYHAIKYFYQQSKKSQTKFNREKGIFNLKGDLNQHKKHHKSYTLFRGAPVNERDLKVLRKGNFIELLGFVSTSKSQQYVRDNFLKRRGDYLFVFHINENEYKNEQSQQSISMPVTHNPSINFNNKNSDLDHGYVDLSQFKIATTQFQTEQQVLLNALNIYKVIQVMTEQESSDGVGIIHLKYGAVFELFQKEANSQLTQDERGVLNNYRYCANLQRQIKDHGDVLRHAQEFDKCKDFYTQKIKVSQTMKDYNKLAEAHFYCGDADEARLNAMRSLQTYEIQMQQKVEEQEVHVGMTGKGVKMTEQLRLSNKGESSLSSLSNSHIISLHQKNTDILYQSGDTYLAKRCIDHELALLCQSSSSDWLQRARVLKIRGDILLKQGNYSESYQDIIQAERVILDKLQSFNQRRKEIEKKYMVKYWLGGGCLCWGWGNERFSEMEAEKQEELQTLRKEQLDVQNQKRTYIQLLIQIISSLQAVFQATKDRQSYEECLQRSKAYFNQLQTIFKSANQTTKANEQKSNPDIRQSNQPQLPTLLSPIQQANLLLTQAKVQSSNNPNQASKCKELMQKAIELIQNVQPMNKMVGQLQTRLGLFRQKQLVLMGMSVADGDRSRKKTKVKPKSPAVVNINKKGSLKASKIQKVIPMTIIDEEKSNGSSKQNFSGQKHKQQSQQEQQDQHFDYTTQKNSFIQIKQNFVKAMQIAVFNQNSEDTPKVFECRNNLGQLSYNYTRFTETIEHASIVLESQKAPQHQEGAKAALLLGKVYLTRGELKLAFKMIEKATSILRTALIKQHASRYRHHYQSLFGASPLFIDIELYKCKTYNRQMKHDLALKTILKIEQIASDNLKQLDGAGCLPDIYEEHAKTLVLLGDSLDFENYYIKAIRLRQSEMGKYNIPNAVSLSMLFKYMLGVEDWQTAHEYLQESHEIFNQFPSDHPTAWVHFAAMALFYEKTNLLEQELRQLHKSVKLMDSRYSKSHINYLKIKVKYAEALRKNNLLKTGTKQFKNIQNQLKQGLRTSHANASIETRFDDQKIGIQEHLAQSMRQIRQNFLANGLEYRQDQNEDRSVQENFSDIELQPNRRERIQESQFFPSRSRIQDSDGGESSLVPSRFDLSRIGSFQVEKVMKEGSNSKIEQK